MRNKTVILVALLAAFLCIASLSSVASAQVQRYYVLGNESGGLLDAYETIDLFNTTCVYPVWSSGSMTGTVSIVSWEDNVNVSVYKDESGYGHWNNTMLDRGDILTFARDDLGGDYIEANGSISVIRTAWREQPGTYAAGTWELFPVNKWEDEYVVPITQNFVELIVQASEDNTTVDVTYPNDTVVSVTLDRGEDQHFANATQGTEIKARDNKAIQAGLVTSNDTIACFTWWGIRYYTLTPKEMLGNDYYIPVPSFSEYYSDPPLEEPSPPPTRLWIYAVENSTVYIEDGTGYDSGNITVNKGQAYTDYFMPNVTGVYYNEGTNTLALPGNATHVYADSKIWVVGVCDDYDGNYDWGFQALNTSWLGYEYYVPWSPANPAYVTPIEDNTQFHVDYNLTDGIIDLNFVLNKLQMYMIYPNATSYQVAPYNLTGARIWTDENKTFAIQWGQDNNQNTPGERASPDKDFGYAMLYIPLYREPEPGTVDGYVYEDRNCNCTYDDEPGVANVTVELVNNATTSEVVNTTKTDGSGYYKFTNVTAGDYTVRYNADDLYNNGIPPYRTPKCDDGEDYVNPTEGSVTVPEGGHDSHNFGVESEVGISIVKLVDGVESKLVSRNDMVTYTLNITNIGKANLTNLTVVDVLPDELSWADAASPVQDSVAGQTITWGTNLTSVLEPDGWFVITFNATVDSDAEFGVTCTNNATVNATSDWGDVSAYDTADVIIETLTPGIRIIKLVNGVNSITAARNETVTFTLEITNIGSLNLTNLTVTDALPLKKANKGLTYADAANPPEDGLASSIDSEGWIHFTIHWWGYDTPPGSLAQFEPLKPGDSFVISFNATVDSDAEGVYRDVATVTGESEGDDVSDSDDAFVFVGTHRVPVLTPFGVAALIGLLSLVAVLGISKSKGIRRKRG